jgi:hypothetical protein
MPEDKYEMAVNAIISDLTGRRGLRHEWDNIDDDIQDEIRETWRNLIEQAVETVA